LPGGAAILLWLLVLVPPFVFSIALKDNFRLPKLVVSEILAAASLIPLAWRAGRTEGLDWRRLVRHPATLAVVPILAAASVGLLASEHGEHVRRALPSLWLGGVALWAWSVFLEPGEKRTLLRLLVLPGTLLALLGVLQFHGLYTPFEFAGEVRERLQMTSLAGGAFDLSAYLLLPALIAQYLAWRARSLGERIAWAAALLSMLYAIAATQTLTSIAALVVGSAVLWALLLPRRRFAAALGLGLALLIAAGVTIAPLRERLSHKADALASGDVAGLLSGRLDGWRAAGWMFGEHPLVGVGHGAYRAEFAEAKWALLEEGAEFYGFHELAFFANAHSEPLEIAAEWGVLGLLALAFSLAVVGRELARVARSEPGPGPAPAILVAGSIAMGTLAVANFPLRLALVAYPFLLLLSAVLAEDREAGP